VDEVQPGKPHALPPAFSRACAAWRDVFPWSEPVVFRAGRYVVHRVEGPVRRLLPENYAGRREE
jgi:hypothetical protein